MSRYTANSFSIAVDTRRAELEALTSTYFTMPCVTSAQLIGSISRMPANSPAELLDSRWRSLGALTGAADILRQTSADSLTAALQLTYQSKAYAALGDGRRANVLARRADRLLRTAVAETAERLRSDERRIAAAATAQALQSLGYRLRIAHGDQATGIWAERGHDVIAILAPDDGPLEIDVAGLRGTSCNVPVAELGEQLRRLGVDTSVERSTDHGDERGGVLIRGAGLIAPDNLARGLVEQHEQAQGPRRRSARAIPTPVPQRIGGTR